MTAIIVVAVLVGLIWSVVFVLRGSLLEAGLVLLVVGYCFGHRLLSFDLGPIPLTLDRLMLCGLLLVYAIQRRLGLADPKPPTWSDLALFGLAGLLLLSTFAGNWQVDVPGKVSPVWRLVAGYLMPVALYWIVRQSRVTRRGLTNVYAFLTLLGLYLAVTALAEVAQQWWLVYPTYIRDAGAGIHFGRARGPVLQSQSLGLYLVICLLCAWMWRRRLGRVGQLVLIALSGLFLAAIFFTYTRCVWMGLAAGALIVLGLCLRRGWRPLVLGSAVAAGLLAAVLCWDRLVGLERDGSAATSRSSVRQRASFTYVSWKMFLDRPLLGVGFGQFPDAVKPYLSDRSTSLHLENIRDYPHHNTFLSLLTETGLVGMGLFVAVLCGWARGAWRMYSSVSAPEWVRGQGLAMLGVLAIFVCPSMFFDLTYSPHDHWLVFFLAGVTAGLRPLADAAATATAGPLPAVAGSLTPFGSKLAQPHP